jgi:hypothetical protein
MAEQTDKIEFSYDEKRFRRFVTTTYACGIAIRLLGVQWPDGTISLKAPMGPPLQSEKPRPVINDIANVEWLDSEPTNG